MATFSAHVGLEAPRTPPKGLLGNVLERLGGVLGTLGGQGPNKNDFGGPLGLILGGFWEMFGRFLGGF